MGRGARQLLSLEDAIRRLTFQPARIGVKEDEVSHDGPAGVPRRAQGAEGVHYVVGGGQVVLDHGQHTGALPGRVLRAVRHSMPSGR